MFSVSTHRYIKLASGLGVVCTFMLAFAVYMQEEKRGENLLREEAEHLSLGAEAQLKETYRALDRIAQRWIAQNGTPEALWIKDVSNYLHDFSYIYAIARTDEKFKVTWLESRGQKAPYIGMHADFEPLRRTAMEAARKTRQPQLTPSMELLNGKAGFLYISPLYSNGHFDGVEIAAIDTQTLFAQLIASRHEDNLDIAVTNSGLTLYRSQQTPVQAHMTTATAFIHHGDEIWRMEARPADGSETPHTALPFLVLLGGIMATILATLSSYLLLRSRIAISDLQQREEELHRSNQLNSAILGSSQYLMIATDEKGVVIEFNPAAEYALGYRAEDIEHQHTPLLWHDAEEVQNRAYGLSTQLRRHVEADLSVFTTLADMHGSEEREWTFIRKDGTRFPGLLNVTPMHDTLGRKTGYLGVIKDITESKAQQEALAESEEMFRLAMENASIGKALISPEGSFLRCNGALCKLVGYTQAEMAELDFQRITHPDDLQTDMTFVQQMLAGKIQTYQMEKRYIHKDGHIIWVMLSVSLVRYPDGRPKYFISQMQDITARKHAEAELAASQSARQQLIEKLTQSNTELERFAYVASHDMQEPLRMMSNFSELLMDEYAEKLEGDGHQYLTFVRDSALRMQEMVSDLLEYARAGSGETRIGPVNANEELRHVLNNLGASIRESGARVTADNLPQFEGNAVQFTSLLQNLVSNGLKYQPPGGKPVIHISAADEGDFWRFCVQDNGIGIEPEYIATVFEPFRRLHAWSDYHGTGLGLAVCRKIAENHGGRIWAESRAGQGSAFYFTILKKRGMHTASQGAA